MTSKFVSSTWYTENLHHSLLFVYFKGDEKYTRLKRCQNIYSIDFPSFFKINSLDVLV